MSKKIWESVTRSNQNTKYWLSHKPNTISDPAHNLFPIQNQKTNPNLQNPYRISSGSKWITCYLLALLHRRFVHRRPERISTPEAVVEQAELHQLHLHRSFCFDDQKSNVRPRLNLKLDQTNESVSQWVN